MTHVYLGLGTNQGDRRAALEFALSEIAKLGFCRTSCIYETHALLPQGSSSDWNVPFLNMAVELQYEGTPYQLLHKIHQIELSFGRERKAHWAPRTLDIDILLWEGLNLNSTDLQIPHPEMLKRSFVLDPLKDLCPHFQPEGQQSTLLELSHQHPQHLPAIMSILNITPDSFSDGGEHCELVRIESYLGEIENEVAYIDIGAESTRPRATPLSPAEEWARLEPVLSLIKERYRSRLSRPKISIDTYHGEVAARAVEFGVDVINDVGGFTCPVMKELLSAKQKTPFKGQYVLMHSLTVPADPSIVVNVKQPVIDELYSWFEKKIAELESVGFSRDRIIIDPGLGFGKNAAQSFEIVRGFSSFWSLNCQVLIGHSRKSFLAEVSSPLPQERDPASISLSVELAKAKADILRVHNPIAHKRAVFLKDLESLK